MMTHAASLFNIRTAVVSWGWRHEDVHLLVIPLFHCTAAYSAMPTSVYLGSTLVLAPRPDPAELLGLIERHCCTTFLGVPSLFHLVVTSKSLPGRDLSSLRMLGYSGSPMPTGTIRRLRAALPGVSLHNFFGLTETISNTHVTADRDADERPDSIGKPLPEVFQRIVDDDGRAVGAGEVGELCFARENVIPGYWGRPDLLEESVRDGWFRTGDLAMVDSEGYTYIRGRKKDMIIVAGENVYALEVERILVQHPKVLEAAVVGVRATGAASYMGEMVKAVLVVEEGADVTAAEIRRFCIERMASYQVPQIVEFRAYLPRTPSGKVIKRELV
jgi:long-chain acyl-CoA synthetase